MRWLLAWRLKGCVGQGWRTMVRAGSRVDKADGGVVWRRALERGRLGSVRGGWRDWGRKCSVRLSCVGCGWQAGVGPKLGVGLEMESSDGRRREGEVVGGRRGGCGGWRGWGCYDVGVLLCGVLGDGLNWVSYADVRFRPFRGVYWHVVDAVGGGTGCVGVVLLEWGGWWCV